MMYKTGFVSLLLHALLELSLGVSSKYYYVPLLKTWTEAQSYCRQNSLDLATIENDEDWAAVREILQETAPMIWVGLYADITSWRWSLDNTYLYRDGVSGFSDWLGFTAEKYMGREQCVTILGGALYDISCSNRRYPLCYDDHTNTYVPGTKALPWLLAQSYCRQNYTDLTSIRNQQERDKIFSVVSNDVPYWIGLSRDSWKWSDQSNFEFSVWATGEPKNQMENEFCGSAHLNGWFDKDCANKYPFLCSGARMTLFKVLLKPEGPVDLNDPSVLEDVLKHMERQINEHGINQNLKLTWMKQLNGSIFNRRETEPTFMTLNNTV